MESGLSVLQNWCTYRTRLCPHPLHTKREFTILSEPYGGLSAWSKVCAGGGRGRDRMVQEKEVAITGMGAMHMVSPLEIRQKRESASSGYGTFSEIAFASPLYLMVFGGIVAKGGPIRNYTARELDNNSQESHNKC